MSVRISAGFSRPALFHRNTRRRDERILDLILWLGWLIYRITTDPRGIHVLPEIEFLRFFFKSGWSVFTGERVERTLAFNDWHVENLERILLFRAVTPLCNIPLHDSSGSTTTLNFHDRNHCGEQDIQTFINETSDNCYREGFRCKVYLVSSAVLQERVNRSLSGIVVSASTLT